MTLRSLGMVLLVVCCLGFVVYCVALTNCPPDWGDMRGGGMPGSTSPGSTAAGWSVPGSTAGGWAVPGTTAGGWAVPKGTSPGWAVPGVTESNALVPIGPPDAGQAVVANGYPLDSAP